jgi:sugar phosphate isomerase/epimerase
MKGDYNMKNIGLQLYSIKELTGEDFIGTLEKVAKIGYTGVEFAGYFNTSAKDLKNALDTFGLKAAGSHIGINAIVDNLDEVIEYSLQINDPYIICPGLPVNMRDSADAYKRLAELFNKAGEKCKKHGIQFGYHNHDFEFEKFNGEYGLDLLTADTDPDLVHIELDTFWVEYCGLKSVDFINKYKERCSLLHIKDMKSWEEKINTEIGKGVMDFKSITELGKNYNVKWYTVEQEEFDIPQLQSIEESFKYLNSIL